MKRKKWEMPGVKAGSRRAAAVTLTVLLAAVCGGCGNQYSVEDAVSRDENLRWWEMQARHRPRI